MPETNSSCSIETGGKRVYLCRNCLVRSVKLGDKAIFGVYEDQNHRIFKTFTPK